MGDNIREMYVVKRDGTKEEVYFDKVLRRIKNLSDGLIVNPTLVSQKICTQIYNCVKTSELDELGAEICAAMITEHPDYGILAARITISNHQKNTSPSFSETIQILYDNVDVNNKHTPLVSKSLYDIVIKNKIKLNDVIDYSRDFYFDYFGFKTLQKSYLIKKKGVIIERPQHMIMRVSLGIHNDDFKEAIRTYHLISKKYFVHATPTLFNSGTPKPQLSSCFLLAMKDDSIDGIYDTLKQCALISQCAGGIGLHIHNIRAKYSIIRGTNGTSNGLVPMLKVFNSTACYVDQGGGKRNGSIAIYLEPWHPDVFDFLLLKKNHGAEEERARDLFYALWLPDLFMERVANDKDWTLMCPDECKGLSDVYGDDFKVLYERYESENKGRKTVSARKLWFAILESQIETGTPYLLYKDAVNRKTNQMNLGVIKSSNLCTEIMEYTSPEEVAVCNLASLGLPMYVEYPKYDNLDIKIYSKNKCNFCTYAKKYLEKNGYSYETINLDNNGKRAEFFMNLNEELEEENDEYEMVNTLPQIYINNERVGGFYDLLAYFKPTFNFKKLYEVTKVITKNLNKVIDINYYPIKEAKTSNKRHRPIGIGVQGLADVFAKFKIAFNSDEAKQLNKQIFETIYFAALESSMEIAKKREGQMIRYKELLNKSSFYRNAQCFDNSKDEDEFYKLDNILKCIPEELEMETNIGAYSSYNGSPVSKGILQYDMWDVTPSDLWDWAGLKESISKYGIRNSLLLAPMPTASTSQILGNNEAIEAFTSNIYSRRTLAGEFMVVNKYLIKDLLDIGLWSKEIKDKIILDNGSISNINEIPDYYKNIYKTVWEMSQKDIIDMAVDRGAYICQSQSLNLFMSEPDYKKLSSMHIYAWKSGLKTGIYYLRTRAVAKAQQFTIDPSKAKKYTESKYEVCESCSG
tara:strand:+ start:12657 stop:15407 length:2751 start_codon:yes stop_codon:yes gene_type:complete